VAEIRLATAAELARIQAWTPYELRVPATRDPARVQRHLPALRASPPERRTPPGVRRLHLVAAEADGRLLGFLTLLLGGRDALSGEALGYIADLQVLPAARRHGLGRRLLAAAIALARREGMALLTLDVAEGNRAARRLYASAGFAPEARRLGMRLDGHGPARGGRLVLGD
jgi:ribosomal protein S18 acetylase RimI-like enzyme